MDCDSKKDNRAQTTAYTVFGALGLGMDLCAGGRGVQVPPATRLG
jgi:hypothetical protein